MSETETITVEILLSSRLEHEGSYGIVTEQDSIEFLKNAVGVLTAESALTKTLVGIDFIDRQFNLRALMIGLDQEGCLNSARVKQSSHQAMDLLMTNPIRIINGVFNDAYQQRFA